MPADKPRIVTPPNGVDCLAQATGGYSHSLAIGSDGNLYSWGYNYYNQLGRNPSTSNPHNRPGIVTPPNGIHFTQAIAGGYHSLAFGSDGNLYSWGYNKYGQLGRNTTDSQDIRPGIVTPPKGITFTQAFAGFEYSMAFGSDGNLYSWGYDTLGQLGRETSGATNESPGKVAFPDKPIITSIKFDQSPGTNLKANTDGTWSVTTPAHEKGLVDVTISWTMNGEQPDLHFVYRYTGPKYKVTFDSAGGSSIDAQSVIEGDQAKRPAIDPTKPGWLFDGWFIGNTAYDFSIPVTGKVTLTAHWSKADTRWNIDKDNGPESGGQTVTLTPPPARDIRFNQADAGDIHSGAIGSDGNIYTWGDNQKN